MSAAEPTSGEQGSLNLGVSHSADTPSEPTPAAAAETPASAEAPVSEPVISEPSMSEPSLSESATSSDSTKVEAARPEAKPVEASAPASQPETAKEKISDAPGKVIVMSRGERAWTDSGAHSEPETEKQGSVFGARRIAAIAAVLALATAAGAVGGALATASFMHGTSTVAANTSQTSPSQASLLARIDSDIQALKAGLDHTSKLGTSQFNKTTDRLDKLERAQAEPAAKLAKLSEAIDRLHALPVPPPAVVAAAPAASTVAKDTTGSIPSAPAQQQVAAAKSDGKTEIKGDMKSEVGRLPTLDDWVLRDVAYGGAVIGGRRGAYEVYAGDYIPGLGRIDAIRRQDGRWVVVTSRGLIVAR